MGGRTQDFVILDEFARNPKNWAIEYYINDDRRCNYILKGKKMENVFEVTVVQRDSETGKLTTLVPITTVLATSTEQAKQKTLIANATVLQTSESTIKEGIDVLVRPFC